MIKECLKCGARWIDGQLYWADGKEGCPHAVSYTHLRAHET